MKDATSLVLISSCAVGIAAMSLVLTVSAAAQDFDPVQRWKTQIGSLKQDNVFAISANGRGNVMIGGRTAGQLCNGIPEERGGQAFVAAYSISGEQLWCDQWGGAPTTSSVVYRAASDPFGNFFCAGSSNSGILSFLRKYDETGNLCWEYSLPTSGSIHAIATDVCGCVYLASGYPNLLRKIGPDGREAWPKAHGTGHSVTSIHVSLSGELVLGGHVSGPMDIAISWHSKSGEFSKRRVWKRDGWQLSHQIAVNRCGDVFVPVRSQEAVEHKRGFILRYSPRTDSWIEREILQSCDWIQTAGVATDHRGFVYVQGVTKRVTSTENEKKDSLVPEQVNDGTDETSPGMLKPEFRPCVSCSIYRRPCSQRNSLDESE